VKFYYILVDEEKSESKGMHCYADWLIF